MKIKNDNIFLGALLALLVLIVTLFICYGHFYASKDSVGVYFVTASNYNAYGIRLDGLRPYHKHYQIN